MRPAGKFFCPRCFMHTDFYQGPDHSPEADEGPVRCWECDYEYGMIASEIDEEGNRLMIPRRRWAITAAMRRQAILKMRQNLWDAAQSTHQFLHRIGRRPQ